MVNGDGVGVGPSVFYLCCNLLEDLQRHGLVGLVLQKQHFSAQGFIADGAAHRYNSSIAWMVGGLVNRIEGEGGELDGEIGWAGLQSCGRFGAIEKGHT